MGMGDVDTVHTTQHIHIAVTIEPKAARMLEELCAQLYPAKCTSQTRA